MNVKRTPSEPESERVVQGRRTRRALIDAARREFGARGYANTSVDDIVEGARVTKGAFYHHFSGKKELFAKVFEQVTRELSRGAFVTHVEHRPFQPREEQPRRLFTFRTQTAEEVWSHLMSRCRRYIELHTEPAVQQIALIDAQWVLDWREAQAIREEQGVVLLRADLRRTRTRGLLKPVPLRETAVLLKGALHEACMLVVDAEDPEVALDEVMTVIEALLGGLRVSSEGDGG